MRAIVLTLFLALGATAAAVAQATDARTDSLIARAEAGNVTARQQLAPVARDLVQLVSGKGVDAVTARTAARAALALAGPISSLEASETSAEREWRAPAVRALRAALAADSGDVWSAGHLEAIAPYPYIWMNPDAELKQLRALAARHPTLPRDLALTRIRLEAERGSIDSAALLLDQLPTNVVSAAIRGHVVAEIDFARGADVAGRAAYFSGVAAIGDDIDAAWYTRDLLLLAQAAELKEWHDLSTAERPAWLEAFWMRRDIMDARMPGTRVAEQFRRWRIALRDYRWEFDGITAEGAPIGELQQSMISPGDDFPMDESSYLAYAGALGPGSHIVDDRGRMVIRHGEPIAHSKLPAGQDIDMETLAWLTPDGPLLIGFSRPQNCVNRTDCISLTRYGMIARSRPMGDLMSLCNMDSRLCALAGLASLPNRSGGRGAASNRARLIQQDYSRMRDIAETTDGNAETYRDSLGAIIEGYGIPQGGVLVVFAIPAKKLVPNGSVRDTLRSYTTRMRVLVGDATKGEVVSAVDTVRTFRVAHPLSSDNYLTAYLVVNAPTGDWQVEVVVSDTLHRLGTGERISQLSVVPFDGHSLRLGDPILGRDGSGLVWNHRGEAIALNATNAWRKDEPAVLTYEIDGMVVGRSYQTRIELWDAGGQPKAPKNVTSFTEQATVPFQLRRRELSLRELSPGDYRLVIHVRDMVTGTEATRERRLAVRK